MDIAKFNKELGYKVAKATGLENNNKIKEAIDEWVNVSEMVIKASKSPNLEFSYKSMLIEKTKQIIDHIKSLKLKLTGKDKKVAIIESHSEPQGNFEIHSNENVNQNESYVENVLENDIKPVEFIEKSEFKNLPKGFKEIKAEEDFEIITPHDKDYIKRLISEDKTHIPNEETTQIPLDRNENICFACGVKVPSNAKVCPQCGTKLKK